MGVGSDGPRASRDSMKATLGSTRVSSWTIERVLAHVGHLDDPRRRACGVEHHAVLALGAEPDRLAVAQRDEHLVADLSWPSRPRRRRR